MTLQSILLNYDNFNARILKYLWLAWQKCTFIPSYIKKSISGYLPRKDRKESINEIKELVQLSSNLYSLSYSDSDSDVIRE